MELIDIKNSVGLRFRNRLRCENNAERGRKFRIYAVQGCVRRRAMAPRFISLFRVRPTPHQRRDATHHEYESWPQLSFRR